LERTEFAGKRKKEKVGRRENVKYFLIPFLLNLNGGGRKKEKSCGRPYSKFVTGT